MILVFKHTLKIVYFNNENGLVVKDNALINASYNLN